MQILRPWLRAAMGVLALSCAAVSLLPAMAGMWSLAGPVQEVARADVGGRARLRLWYRWVVSSGHTWLTLQPLHQDERVVCWWSTEYVAPSAIEVRGEVIALHQ